jgi:hypothetical protein
MNCTKCRCVAPTMLSVLSFVSMDLQVLLKQIERFKLKQDNVPTVNTENRLGQCWISGSAVKGGVSIHLA